MHQLPPALHWTCSSALYCRPGHAYAHACTLMHRTTTRCRTATTASSTHGKHTHIHRHLSLFLPYVIRFWVVIGPAGPFSLLINNTAHRLHSRQGWANMYIAISSVFIQIVAVGTINFILAGVQVLIKGGSYSRVAILLGSAWRVCMHEHMRAQGDSTVPMSISSVVLAAAGARAGSMPCSFA